MIRLGFKEFIRNIKRNALIMVQMVAVYVIIMFTVSAFEEQYRLMDGVSNVFDDTGMIVLKNPVGTGEFMRIDVLEDILIKVDNIEYAIRYNLNHNGYSTVVSSYDSKKVTYQPELVKGKWCDDVEHEEGVINAVVSTNMPFAEEVGEIIEIDGHTFKVTGFVDEKEMVYGTTGRFNYDEASYMDFYQPIHELEQNDNGGLIIASFEDIQKYSTYDTGYSSLWSLISIVDFEDDITEEEIEYNMDQMAKTYGYTQGSELILTDNMYEYSWRLMMLKIMPMLMLLAVIIIVLVVSLVISGTINILYERKNYGIYFICGNDWKNTFRFSLVNWSIMALVSMVIASGACILIYSKKLIKGLILSFTGMHVLAIFGITAAMLLIAVFIPYIKLRRIQPVSILKENNK